MDQMLGLSTGTFGYIMTFTWMAVLIVFMFQVRKMPSWLAKSLFFVQLIAFFVAAIWYRANILMM